MEEAEICGFYGSRMIEAQDLTKRYGQRLAVDRLSFTVRPGVVTGFLGPNGAGKTTTMRLLLGLDAATSGTATVTGQRYTDLAAPMRTVGALLDAGAMHPSRTARDHLLCLARSNGIGKSRIRQVLAEVGLADVADRRVGRFSLGMRQRLGIAGALLGDPAVLLFDEPINGLDPEGIRWMRGVLRTLAGEGRTVLVSSHLMNEMAVTADHVIVIGRGRLIADAPVAALTGTASDGTVLVRTPLVDDLYTPLADTGAVVDRQPPDTLLVTGRTSAQIGEIAAVHGIPLVELTPQRASLEAAFMAMTQDSIEFGAVAGR